MMSERRARYPQFTAGMRGHNGHVVLDIPNPHGGNVRFMVEVEYRRGCYRIYWNAPGDVPCMDDIYVIGEEENDPSERS